MLFMYLIIEPGIAVISPVHSTYSCIPSYISVSPDSIREGDIMSTFVNEKLVSVVIFSHSPCPLPFINVISIGGSMAEWLKRRTRNLKIAGCTGSNPVRGKPLFL